MRSCHGRRRRRRFRPDPLRRAMRRMAYELRRRDDRRVERAAW